MSEAVESLIIDLLEWVDSRERTYEEVMEAWRTSCPRLPVWEEANDRGLLVIEKVERRSVVRVTGVGFDLLRESGRAVTLMGERMKVETPRTPGAGTSEIRR
jgi:hypothetical protein